MSTRRYHIPPHLVRNFTTISPKVSVGKLSVYNSKRCGAFRSRVDRRKGGCACGVEEAVAGSGCGGSGNSGSGSGGDGGVSALAVGAAVTVGRCSGRSGSLDGSMHGVEDLGICCAAQNVVLVASHSCCCVTESAAIVH